MNNILITSAGQRVSLVKAFQKELKCVDGNAKVYTVDLNPVLAPACQVSDGYRAVPHVMDDTYIPNLVTICRQWNIKMIVPTIDTELQILSMHKSIFEEEGIIPIISERGFVDACRDKRISNKFFKEHGIDIPVPYDKNNPIFPMFIKPFDGSLSKDIFLVRDPSELTVLHLDNPKLMFMEYIDPREHDEYTVDCYYNKNNKLCCVVPRKRIFVRAGEVNKGVTHKNRIVKFIQEKLPEIKGAIGCLTMQFFFNFESERIIGIEINPRFGGGYPLSYLAGANYPKCLIDEYLFGKEVTYFEDWESDLLMLRYDDEVLVHNYIG